MADNPQALTLGGNIMNQAFVQQGEVDWVAFGNTIFSASLAMMQRMANAGIQPVTHGAGLAIASQFKLSADGKRRMDEALKDLRCFQGFESVLYFGFGLQSFVRVLSQTQIGINCVALCACLADCHSSGLSASILKELWRELDFPEEFEPAQSQFLALIKACAGVVAETPFSSILFLMLEPKYRTAHKSERIPKASNARDTAAALKAIFELSTGATEQICLRGGPECGFLAALGHWLFSFPVYVEDENGTIVFTSAVSPETAKLKVSYGSPEAGAMALDVTATTYVLGHISQMIMPDNFHIALTPRVSWETCLSQVFPGAALDKLLSRPKHLANYIGSYVRIHAGLLSPEESVETCGELCIPLAPRPATYFSPPSTYDIEFLHRTWEIFPELKLTAELPEQALIAMRVRSVNLAISRMIESIRTWELTCACDSCCQHSSSMVDEGDDFCMIRIAWTICRLVTVLGWTVRSPNLYPSVAGLRRVYASAPSQSESISTRPEVLLLHLENSDQHWPPDDDLLTSISHLFTGRESALERKLDQWGQDKLDVSALCKNGICTYINALQTLTTDVESARLIHILPGHIEWKGRRFGVLWDGPLEWLDNRFLMQDGDAADEAELEIRPDMDSVPTYTSTTADAFRISTLAIDQEDSSHLRIAFQIAWPTSGQSLLLYPRRFTNLVLKSTAWNACGPDTCGKAFAEFTPNLDLVCVRSGWFSRYFSQSPFPRYVVWPRQGALARCVAFRVSSCVAGHQSVMLRQNDCLKCAICAILSSRQDQDPNSTALESSVGFIV